jgi:hypothetical protein
MAEWQKGYCLASGGSDGQPNLSEAQILVKHKKSPLLSEKFLLGEEIFISQYYTSSIIQQTLARKFN